MNRLQEIEGRCEKSNSGDPLVGDVACNLLVYTDIPWLMARVKELENREKRIMDSVAANDSDLAHNIETHLEHSSLSRKNYLRSRNER